MASLNQPSPCHPAPRNSELDPNVAGVGRQQKHYILQQLEIVLRGLHPSNHWCSIQATVEQLHQLLRRSCWILQSESLYYAEVLLVNVGGIDLYTCAFHACSTETFLKRFGVTAENDMSNIITHHFKIAGNDTRWEDRRW